MAKIKKLACKLKPKRKNKMEANLETMTINGTKYVRADAIKEVPEIKDDYFLIRTYAAGVFFCKVRSIDKTTRTAILDDSRRVWYWSGAQSLSQLAVDGTSKPNDCKISVPVNGQEVFQVEEKIPLTEKAFKSLSGTPLWKM